jgi:hypothetical protein
MTPASKILESVGLGSSTDFVAGESWIVLDSAGAIGLS